MQIHTPICHWLLPHHRTPLQTQRIRPSLVFDVVAGAEKAMKVSLLALLLVLFLILRIVYGWDDGHALKRKSPTGKDGLCARLLLSLEYPCDEHAVQTEDGFLLSVQRIRGRRALRGKLKSGPPVFLQHGLFQGGDAWFMNSVDESLGFLLADHGFDVWVGNVRGTRWTHGHISLSVHNKEFWDWSWEELAKYDLDAMISYVYSVTKSKIFYIGHSQGTIMALSAFTMPNIVAMIEAAALLCPISYLNHISARLVLRAVSLHLDQLLATLGIHELNFRSDMGIQILDAMCDGHVDCNDLLASVTGENCCFNVSRMDYYLEYEPHPSSTKNLNHLFQMIRKGTFAKYDYGWWGNLKRYGHLHPPKFDLADIPESLPLWMAYGGQDALADVTDVKRTIKGLRSKPVLLYNDSYGHIDFVLSVNGKDDVYDNLISFLGLWGRSSSY